MGSLFRKPSELVIRPTYKCLIYGEPGLGKSTLALSAPNPVVFDFDGGITRVNAAHQCPTLQIGDERDANGRVTKLAWAVVMEAMQELKNGGNDFQTIVIDTAGKMLGYMDDFIIATDTTAKHLMKNYDGSLSLKGYGVRKNMFINFRNECSKLGMHVIFVAHAKEERKTVNNKDIVYSRPDIGGSSCNDLIKELDLVGYSRADGYRRTITWNPSDEFYAKNACNLQPNMEIPNIIGRNGEPIGANNFMSNIFDLYTNYLNEQHNIRKRYDELLSRIDAAISAIDSAEKANTFIGQIEGMVTKGQHIWDSKVVAETRLSWKCGQIGLKFNPSTGKYEAA